MVPECGTFDSLLIYIYLFIQHNIYIYIILITRSVIEVAKPREA